MLGIALLCNEFMDIGIIVALVCTQVLIFRRSPNHNMQNQVIERPFIVLIGSRDPNGQQSAALIDQNMDFAALFGSISGMIVRITVTQGRRTRTTVHRLPFQRDMFSAAIEIQQRAKDLLPNARLLPGLKALMQDTAGDAKPTTVNRLPMTSCPEDLPNAVQNGVIGFSGTPGTGKPRLFGKVLFRYCAKVGAEHRKNPLVSVLW